MENKDKKKIGIVFSIILLMGIFFDWTKGNVMKEGIIMRNDVGEKEEEINLILNMEGYKDSYEYLLEVEAMRVTEEQAKGYFAGAIQEIEEDFRQLGSVVPRKEAYQSGIVEAEWSFEPWNVVKADGTVEQKNIQEDGLLISASVTLSCGEYEQIYQFSFELEPKELSVEEKVLAELDDWVAKEMEKEGEQALQLPLELEGIALQWSAKSDSFTLKILVLEIIAIVLIWYLQKKKQEAAKRKLDESMELDYPDIVEQLALLLGAGMTIRQAWNRIATRYTDKRQKKQVLEKPVFERIVQMNRRLSEGESERIVYQKFADEVGLMDYHRLIRSLLGNLEKGLAGTQNFLEQESRRAYEQRINYAKKLGEEASTRMLLPLMIMMVIVMAIAMIPAMLSFSI